MNSTNYSMDQNEFNQRIKLVNDIIKQSAILRNEILSKNKILPVSINSLIESLSARDTSFTDYLKYIKEFNFTEESSPPALDFFPGLRTTINKEDPEELEQKSNIMKASAQQIDNQSKRSNSLKEGVLGEYKRLLSSLIEYLKQEDRIYELQMDLLKDLDSPYDIGQVAKNT